MKRLNGNWQIFFDVHCKVDDASVLALNSIATIFDLIDLVLNTFVENKFAL